LLVLEEGWEGEEMVERGRDGDMKRMKTVPRLLMLLYEQSIGHG
jgi:hypothetical protein